MAFRLETSKSRPIDNYQGTEISKSELDSHKKIKSRFPRIVKRTNPSPIYDCHGLTFASRRTRIIKNSSIRKIIEDDKYTEIKVSEVLPGDIVVYYSNNGDANHSGIIVEYNKELINPIICSKWGLVGEYIHSVYDIPDTLYGPNVKYFRCLL